jgi:hypothetical protein
VDPRDEFHVPDPADGVTGRQTQRHDEGGEKWALRKPSENTHEESRSACWAICRRLPPIQGPSAFLLLDTELYTTRLISRVR